MTLDSRLQPIVEGCVTRHHAHQHLGFTTTRWKLFEKEASANSHLAELSSTP